MRLLEIEDLSVHFPTSAGTVRAVDTVSLRLEAGERLCLLGESGSGKTVVALAIAGLLLPGAVVRGRIRFDGRDLLRLPRDELRRLRGREIAMVFEQPWTCLNPTMPVGPQIAEAVRAAGAASRGAAHQAA
ncbi:MAG: ATP-binding cassette domain-containing protein, partial [Egibacteraceae bacterium]